MPPPVQKRLNGVVGLMKMPWPQFSEHIIHHVDQLQKEKREAEEQNKQLVKKLNQLQLGELTKKNKDHKSKVQAPVVTSPPQTQTLTPDQAPTASPLPLAHHRIRQASNHHPFCQCTCMLDSQRYHTTIHRAEAEAMPEEAKPKVEVGRAQSARNRTQEKGISKTQQLCVGAAIRQATGKGTVQSIHGKDRQQSGMNRGAQRSMRGAEC